MDLKRLVSMRCSSCSQQRFFGDGGSSGIACPDKHIRHAFFGFITTWQISWGRLLCYDFHSIDALGMGSVCHIYTIVHFLQGAARRSHYFSCAKSVQSQCKVRAMAKRVLTLPSRSLTWRRKVGMKRLCGKGAFLLSQKIFSKRCSFLCTFSKPVKVGCSKFRKISAGF